MSVPKYYLGKYKGIEAMDVVLDFQEDNYNLGVAIAYLLRAGKKPFNPIEDDIEKAIIHLQRELKHRNAILQQSTSKEPDRFDTGGHCESFR
jgi:hypothetical protein